MSEVTTLKQLMLDAARYRWLREDAKRMAAVSMVGERDAVYNYDNWRYRVSKEIDDAIDEMLDRE